MRLYGNQGIQPQQRDLCYVSTISIILGGLKCWQLFLTWIYYDKVEKIHHGVRLEQHLADVWFENGLQNTHGTHTKVLSKEMMPLDTEMVSIMKGA